MASAWQEYLHPRAPKGSPTGGQFVSSDASGAETEWYAATKQQISDIYLRTSKGETAIKRLLPAIKLEKNDQIFIGERGEWHNTIARANGIFGRATFASEIGEYERGFVDPLDHIYYAADDIFLDAAELLPMAMDLRPGEAERIRNIAEFRDAIGMPLPTSVGKKTTEVLVNPTMSEVQRMASDIRRQEIEFKDREHRAWSVNLRAIREPSGNLYVWNASDTVHDVVIETLGLSHESQYDIWDVDTKGHVSSWGPYGSLTEPENSKGIVKRWIVGAQKASKTTKQFEYHDGVEVLAAKKLKLDVSPILRDSVLPSQSIVVYVSDDLYSDTTRGHNIEVLINPTENEIIRMAHDRGFLPPHLQRQPAPFRSIRDVNANLYVWKAGDAIHEQVVHGLTVISKTGIDFDRTTGDDWYIAKNNISKYVLSLIKRGQENAKKYAEQYGLRSITRLSGKLGDLASNIEMDLSRQTPHDEDWHGTFAEGAHTTQEISGSDREIRDNIRDLTIKLGGARQEVGILVETGDQRKDPTSISIFAGGKHSVNLPNRIIQESQQLELHHNHPDALPLSDADIVSAYTQQLSAIHAHTLDGCTFTASNFDWNKFNHPKNLELVIQHAISDAEDTAIDDIPSDNKFWQDTKLNKMFVITHGLMIGLNNAGAFRYSYTLSPERKHFVASYDNIIAKVSRAVKTGTVKRMKDLTEFIAKQKEAA